MVSVKKIVMVTLVAVTMLGLGGLFPHAEASKLDEVQSRGCLLVGTTGDYKPMSYLNRETGRYEGFDTEASELLAQSLGVQVKFIPTTWSTLTADTLAVSPALWQENKKWRKAMVILYLVKLFCVVRTMLKNLKHWRI